MIGPAESIYGGTWSGMEPAPLEFAHFELMLGMKWSWADLQSAPPYVQRYCADLLGIKQRCEAERRQQQQ